MFSICGSSLVDYEKAGKNRERIMKLYPFITKYDWYGINLPSKKDYLVKFEKNNLTVAFNLLYEKEKEIYPAYISKYNSTCEKKIKLLMIPYGKGWQYLAVTNLPENEEE